MCRPTYIWKTNSNLSGMVWSSVGPVAGWCYRLFRTGGLALQPPRQMSATESWLHRHRCCCDYYRMTSTNWTWTLDGWDLVTKDWSALRPTQSTTDDKSYRLCLVFLCIFNYTRCSVDHSNQKCWALFLRNRILSSVFFVLFYFICLLVALDEPNLFENNRDSALKSHYSLTHQLRTDEIMACSTSSFSCRNFFERKSREEPEMRRSPEPTAIFSVGSLHFLTTYIRVCVLNACHPFSKHMPSYSSVARCSSSAVRARQWEWLGVAGCPYIHYIFLLPFVVVDVCAWVNERESIAGQYIRRYTYYYRVC